MKKTYIETAVIGMLLAVCFLIVALLLAGTYIGLQYIKGTVPAQQPTATTTPATSTPVVHVKQASTTPTAAKPTPAPAKPSYAVQAVTGTAITAANVIADVNDQRIAAGIAPLTENAQLDQAAKARLADMEKYNDFAHQSPDGLTFVVAIEQSGYPWQWAGENLAQGFPTVQATVAGWMISPMHKANILKPQYTDTGVAVDGSLVVQEFGGKVK
jgi:uncharacterized protein YkwD